MKSKIILLTSILVATAATSCQESLEDRCARECEIYTQKKCPAPITENIVIDSLVFERGNHTMHYYYTVGGAADSPEAFKRIDAKKLMIKEVKNATTLRLYKEAGYSFAYTYHSEANKGKVICDILVTQKDYK